MVRLVSLTTYMLSIKLLQHLFIKFSGYRVGKPHLKKKHFRKSNSEFNLFQRKTRAYLEGSISEIC